MCIRDSVRAVKQTEFKSVFDDENLYFLIKSFTNEKKFTVYSLKRDFNTASADYVQLIFDTFNDATNAFQFQTNHLGLKGDVLVSGGNRDYRRDRNSSWDAIWYVESKMYEDHFLIEIKIPFNQLYFINGSKKWRFNMYRSDTQSLEHSTWINIPQNQSIGSLAYMGELNFEKPLNMLAYQYDIVCNGIELSSGAIRNHIPELMYKLFAIAGYDKDQVDEKFSGMINALSYGAPPHGGIAPGIDRIIMLLANEKNIREVTMFPMNQNAQDLMMNAPSEVSENQLKELSLSTKTKK